MTSHHPGTQEHHPRHPSFKQYVMIAIILFAITLVEFLIVVPEQLKGSPIVVPPLIVLSVLKFAIVIMFYMHLKFDSRLFTWVFLGGLALGLAVVVALLALFSSFQPAPREFAQANAAPFEHGAGDAPAGPPPEEPPGGAEPGPPGPPPVEPDGPDQLLAQGQAIFTGAGGCGACHTIEGLSSGMVGPDLTHIGTVAAERKPGVSAEEYIRESIEDPAAFVVESYPPAMPANIRDTMSDSEFEALVEFLLAQK